MNPYKSIVLVIIMGGVLLVLAGTLVQTKSMRRGPDASGALPQRVDLGELGLPFARRARSQPSGSESGVPDGSTASFGRGLEALRSASLPTGGEPVARVQAREIFKRTLDLARPTDWPLLRAELARTDLPDVYRSYLVVLAGAVRHSEGLAPVEKHYPKFKLAAVQALAANGSEAAFAMLTRLYDAETEAQDRFSILRASRQFDPGTLAAFLGRVLEKEPDERVMLEAVTACRFVGNETMLASLLTFVRAQPVTPERRRLISRALNSIAGLDAPGAREALLELHLSTGRDPELARLAGDAFSFLRDPDVVPRVVAELGRTAPPSDYLLRYLGRNANASHRALLEAARDAAADEALRSAIEGLLAGLAP